MEVGCVLFEGWHTHEHYSLVLNELGTLAGVNCVGSLPANRVVL